MTPRTLPTLLLSSMVATLLVACGGGDGDGSPSADGLKNLPAPAPDGSSSASDALRYLTTATLYQPQQATATYEAPPAGFTPVFTEAVVRHGARGMSSFDASAYNMWLQAQADNALTPLGAKLGPDLMAIIKANALLGYGVAGIGSPGFGNLSQLGGEEEAQIAARMAQRLPSHFAQVAASAGTTNPRQVVVSYSGVARAVDSSGFFSRSLQASVPGLSPLVTLSAPLTAYPANAPVTQAAGVNRFLLYFHKLTAKTDLVTDPADPNYSAYNDSLAYQAYLNGNANMLGKVNTLINSPAATANARVVLERLFTQDFVNKIDSDVYKFANSGSYTFTSDDGKYTTTVKGDDSAPITSLASAASELYSYYTTVPSMEAELNHMDFTPYIPDAQAAELAYLDDVRTFYQKGPGIQEDNPATYQMAQGLLTSMFNEVDAIAQGHMAHGAKLGFTHAEIIIPLTSILRLPNIFVPVPNASDYTYQNNPWRGSTTSPYAANVQWDVYGNSQGELVVKMLLNEQETDFMAACDGARHAAGSKYYDYAKLAACYGHVAAPAS